MVDVRGFLRALALVCSAGRGRAGAARRRARGARRRRARRRHARPADDGQRAGARAPGRDRRPGDRQVYGNVAKRALSAMAYDRIARVEWSKKDDYGRVVGKLRVGAADVNLKMIRQGLAWHYRAYAAEQSAADRKRYAAAEVGARAQRAGLWQDPDPVAPWLFRHRHPVRAAGFRHPSCDESCRTSKPAAHAASRLTPTAGHLRMFTVGHRGHVGSAPAGRRRAKGGVRLRRRRSCSATRPSRAAPSTAGISAAYAYPGTPSTEIFETVEAYAKARRTCPSRGLWSTNEKVALEEAVGVSYAGKRALVSMKHVGLNVAADPFMNVGGRRRARRAGARGGRRPVDALSSQNEQDSRYFADFAQVPCLEPADQQQCYDFTREAFELSEQLRRARAAAPGHAPRAQPRGGGAGPRAARRTRHATWTPRPLHADSRRTRGAPTPGCSTSSTALRRGRRGARGQRAHAARRGQAGHRGRAAWPGTTCAEALGPKLTDYNVLRIGAYPLPVTKMRALLDASRERRPSSRRATRSSSAT